MLRKWWKVVMLGAPNFIPDGWDGKGHTWTEHHSIDVALEFQQHVEYVLGVPAWVEKNH